MSARITKNELIAIIARLSAEVAALRAELSAAKVQQHAEHNARPQTEHEYPSREEAIEACKRLAASEYNKRVVSLLGELIARARAH